MFWIRGLPGTGKSTLMDFLDEQLQEHHQKLIADPASSRPFQLLKFFFYSSKDSTKLQKSFSGLLRAFCYQILTQNKPELLNEVVKDLSAPWSMRSRLVVAADLPAWTTRDLKQFLRYLIPKSRRRFFCLLDGLDECTEDHSKLLGLLDDFVKLGLKLCCTSRPDEPFLSGLSGLPCIELHNVNSKDIRGFCRRNLSKTSAAHLIDTIVSMSQGVFLWAGLVTLDIRRASAFASDEELLSRLQHCPTEMLDLYEHMIERQAKDEYRQTNPTPYLRIVWECLAWPAEYARLSLYIVFASAIALEEPMALDLLVIDEAALAQMDRRAQNIKSKMLTSCAGLFHFTSGPTDSLYPGGRRDLSFWWADFYETYWDHSSICSDHNFHNLASSLIARPQFVHKTAIDFLTSSPAGHRFLMQYQVSDIEVLLALCKAHGSLLCFDSRHLPNDYRVGKINPWPTIENFLPNLEKDIHLRDRLYQTLDRLLDLTIDGPSSRGTPIDIILAGPLGAPWLEVAVTSPELSIAQNVKYAWVLAHLDVVRFLDWAGLDRGQLQLACALILSLVWVNPDLDLKSTMTTDLLLMVSSGGTSLYTWTQYLEGQKHARLKLEGTTLWTCFVCTIVSRYIPMTRCIREHLHGGGDTAFQYDDRLTVQKESWSWFNSTGLTSAELMHVTILLIWDNTWSSLDVQFVPFFTMDDQGRGLKHTVMFEAFLAPSVLLHQGISYRTHHIPRLTPRRSKPSRIVKCALLRDAEASLHHLPLDDRQSQHLLSELKTLRPADYLWNPYGIETWRKRRLRFCQQALIVLGELVAQRKQDFTDLDRGFTREMTDYADVPHLFDGILKNALRYLEMAESAPG